MSNLVICFFDLNQKAIEHIAESTRSRSNYLEKEMKAE